MKVVVVVWLIDIFFRIHKKSNFFFLKKNVCYLNVWLIQCCQIKSCTLASFTPKREKLKVEIIQESCTNIKCDWFDFFKKVIIISPPTHKQYKNGLNPKTKWLHKKKMERRHAAKWKRNLAPCAEAILRQRIQLHRVPSFVASS